MKDRVPRPGDRLPLVDAREKVDGSGVFVADLRFPGMLHARLVRSPVAHGRIRGVDLTQARRVPGFVGALLPGDPGTAVPFGVLPISEDQTALPAGRVLFRGMPVALVAATTEEAAREAALEVRLDLEELPAVTRLRDAARPAAAPLHPHCREGTSLHKRVEREIGDVDGALGEAAVRVETSWTFPGVTHAFTEPIGCVAVPEGERLTLYTSTQVPHYVQRALAKVLGWELHRVRVVKPLVGGGFGGKSDPFGHEMAVALLARRLGRPLRLILDRDEVFLNNHGRHPQTYRLQLAADAEGRLTALEAEAELDGGAFASFGVVTTWYNGVLCEGPYRIPAFRYRGRRYYTSKPASGAMRGHGAVNARCVLETALDELAAELGLDPFEIRLRNALPAWTTTLGHLRITSNGFRECLLRVREASGWEERWRRLPPGRGLGLGCGFYLSGSALPIHRNRVPQSTVHLKIDLDGGITLHSLAADIGQGSDTMLAQLVATRLGVRLGRVRVRARDTDTAPLDLGSYSSRVTFMAGNAALDAADAVLEELRQALERRTGLPAAGWEPAGDETFTHGGRPEPRVSFDEALEEALAGRGALAARGCYRSPVLGGTGKGAGAGLSPSYSFSAFVVEVEVDEETGFLRVPRVWAAHDAGRALNRTAVEGQIEGSVHMGLGQALSEEMVHRGGRLWNASLLDYKVPTPLETPEIEVLVVESGDPEGPLGAKECGEGALAPVIPALANAIHDATGLRLRRLPFRPDLVLEALDAQERARGRRLCPPPPPGRAEEVRV